MVSLTPNTSYTFALSTASQSIGLRYSDSASYARGDVYYSSRSGVPASSQPGMDLQFAEGIAAAPEPGSWALMILGFGVVGGTLRRRSRAARALRLPSGRTAPAA